MSSIDEFLSRVGSQIGLCPVCRVKADYQKTIIDEDGDEVEEDLHQGQFTCGRTIPMDPEFKSRMADFGLDISSEMICGRTIDDLATWQKQNPTEDYYDHDGVRALSDDQIG